MQTSKNYTALFLIILFAAVNLLIGSNKIFAQENNNQDNDDVILDSIDVKENLLDSNTVYQRDFDSLSNQGEWVKVNRADLIKDVNGNDETVTEDEDVTVVKVIYVWRPYNSGYEWNPYSNGRWVFTYRGWCWESDYNWGWACYNYGRWYWSSYYGWCWMPGRVWAPNWCVWRTYGNYCGWYPTCPRIHWRHHGKWVRNHTFKSKTKNWVFVDKKDFTKKVDGNTIVKNEKNSEILKGSEKIKTVNTFVTDKKTIKYNGPEVTNIANESGEQITPKKVNITRVSNPGVTNETNPKSTKNGNTSSTPEKTKTTRGDGNYNPPKNDGGKTNTTPKYDPPKNNGPKTSGPKSNPPKSNPPKSSGPKQDAPKNSGPKNDGGKRK